MARPVIPGDQPPTNPPLKVLAVEKQENGELLVTVTLADDDPRHLTAAPDADAAVTGLIGHPGVPDEQPAEALPDPARMTATELLDEAILLTRRVDEEEQA